MIEMMQRAEDFPMYAWGLRHGLYIGFFAGAAFATFIALLAILYRGHA